MDQFRQSLPGEGARNFTEEATVHNYRHVLAGQDRQALNFKQADFERAAQENEQAARDEVHFAVAQLLACLERKCVK